MFALTPTQLLVTGGALVALFLWAYWPTIAVMVHAWNTQPDYSHGWFVVPLALLACWMRRDSFPKEHAKPDMLALVLGLSLIAFAAAMRVGSGFIYLNSLDGWSIPLWIAGVVCILFGYRTLYWASPAIAFLFFMIPMPFRAERMLSYPLQSVAAKLSCATLQTLGQPALAENNIILLGDHRLEVAQACSGLRIFVSVAALAFAFIVMANRPWWQKLIIAASVAPIALLVNSLRIVNTGLLYQFVSTEAAEKFSHDLAGYIMIPMAGLMFLGLLWYLGRIVEEEDEMAVGDLVRRSKTRRKQDNSNDDSGINRSGQHSADSAHPEVAS